MEEEADKIRLEDFAVIYEGYYYSCWKSIEALTKEGFHPQILEKPDASNSNISKGNYWIHLAVPNDKKSIAKQFLKRLEEQSLDEAENISSVFTKQVIISSLWTIPVVLLFYFTGYFIQGVIFCSFIWFQY